MRISNHATVIGNHENKHRQKKFRDYQRVPQQIHTTAKSIPQQGPQNIKTFTGLLWVLNVASPLHRVSADQPPAVHRNTTITNVANLTEANHHTTNDVSDAPLWLSSEHAVSLAANTPLLPHSHARKKRAVSIEREHHDIRTATSFNAEQTRTTSSLPDNRNRKNIDANNDVIMLLQRHNNEFLDSTNIAIEPLIESAIAFSQRDESSHAVLANHVQKASAEYGAHPDEVMSLSMQKIVIRNWVAHNILGKHFDSLITEKIIANESSSHWSTENLLTYCVEKIFHTEIDVTNLKKWIVPTLLVAEVPVLSYFYHYQGTKDPDFPRLQSMKLHDLEWGQIHAGLHLAQSVGLGLENVSIATAAELGKMLLIQLKEGTIPNAWWGFFRLPAMIRYAQDHPDLSNVSNDHAKEEMQARALIDYAYAHAKFLNTHSAVSKFNKLMDKYQARPELAKTVLKKDKKCNGMSVTAYLNGRNHCYTIPNKTSFSALDKFPNTREWKIHRLPNINDVFQAQINEIASAYEILDKLLLLTAWNTLADEDSDFMRSAAISRVDVTFSAAHTLNYAPYVGANRHAREGLTLGMKNVEFFAALQPGQPERIYALQKNVQGYNIRRVDRDPERYYDFLTMDDRRPINNTDFKLIVNFPEPVLKNEKQELETLLTGIVKKHSHDFAIQLKNDGYQKTSLEKFSDFLLSLIPFYTCITSVQAGHAGQAALSCSVDVLLFMPVIGNLSRLSIKFGQSLAKGSLMVAHSATAEMMMHHSFQAILRQAGKEFITYAVWPASVTLDKQALQSLGLTMLRTLDPGIELSGIIGRASFTQAMRMGKYMTQSLPELKKLLPKLETARTQLPSKANAEHDRLARLPGIDKNVSVTKLAGDRFRGQEIYVQIHPETGEPMCYWITAHSILCLSTWLDA